MMAALGPDDVERFRGLVARRLGLQFEDAKLGFLADILRRRSQSAGLRLDTYLARLETEESREEIGTLAQEMTVPETYFFRNVEQYRAFSEVALPERLRSAQAASRPVQIVSAGCASGEEPYSLAMVVRDSAGATASNVSVLGLDINPAVLRKAAIGRFSAWVLRETPSDVQTRWFRAEGRDFVIDESIKRSVRFERCNLADESSEFWTPDSYDVVFCRNVLMYFTPARAQNLIDRITRALRPGGYLFLGHAETLRGLSNDFHLRHTHRTFYYSRRETEGIGPRPLPTLGPVRERISPTTLLALVNGADGWVDAIRHASERIEALASGKQPGRARAAAPAKPTWDIGLVLDLLRRERFVEALGLMETFPPESQDDPEVLLLQAVLLTHSSQFTKAEEVCARLLAVDELNAGAHYLLALCREGTGDRAGSSSHDLIAVYLDPAFAMPRLHLGLLARRGGDRTAARRELGQALPLLQREDASRLLLFGGGFSRDALVALCRAEFLACGGRP